MRWSRVLFASVPLICGVRLPLVAQDLCDYRPQNRVFYEECFERSVPLAATVVDVLLKTEEGRQGFDSLPPPDRRDVAKLFRAREVRLGPLAERDFVVIGKGVMSGADNSWFWLVRIVKGRPIAVLWIGALEVELRDTRTNGFRDVRSHWSSAAVTETKTYRFDGRRYKCVKTRSSVRRR